MELIFSRGILLFAFLAWLSGLTASQKPTPPAQRQTQRIPQFDNESVRVWRSVIAPNAALTMHRHDHPRVIVALNGGTISVVGDNGKSEAHVWETGQAYWLPANAPNTMHADVNQGDQAIEVMVVELKHEK
jgi:beta-alanine degradation protein BauB